MDIFSFCLGAASALILALLVVLVVVMVRLNGKLSQQEKALRAVEHNEQEMDRRIGDEVQMLDRQITEERNSLTNSINQACIDANSYTDSRIDKALSKKE